MPDGRMRIRNKPEKYNEQARRLSDNTFKVKPYVLDISLGGSQD